MPRQYTKNKTKSVNYADECLELSTHHFGKGILKPCDNEEIVREFAGLDSYAPPLGKRGKITLFKGDKTLLVHYEVILSDTPHIKINFKQETGEEYIRQTIYLGQETIKFGVKSYMLCECGRKTNKLYLGKARTGFKCRYCLKLKYRKKPRQARGYELEHLIDSHLQAPELRAAVGRLRYGGVITRNAERALKKLDKIHM